MRWREEEKRRIFKTKEKGRDEALSANIQFT